MKWKFSGRASRTSSGFLPMRSQKHASAGSNSAGLGQLSNTVWDRSRRSVALIERSHRSNPKPWNPKHVNRDEESGSWPDSSLSCVRVQQLRTAEEAGLAALGPEVTAASSAFNPHFNYSASACSHIPEEIPDFLASEKNLFRGSQETGTASRKAGCLINTLFALQQLVFASLHAAAELLNSF